ncbi:hypothetical protein QWY85_19375 [Neolewinella lacunae]|uniref:Uncharacterized protein n=1 Tax=Neolewinella lacunae TaxID=1517758 RepID=A0A923PL70_9BACT|nr:hypothetical protein [Neolewinella lacunae]MBC6993319.1 hypothetical protein [Neolewinella lacunae]MDN3636840.1 hypothetical protein [Neolewinella lacunae]
MLNKNTTLPSRSILIAVPLIASFYLLAAVSLSRGGVVLATPISAIYELITIPVLLFFGSSIMMGIIKYRALSQVLGAYYWLVASVLLITLGLVVYASC